jgi:hypothetical protein
MECILAQVVREIGAAQNRLLGEVHGGVLVGHMSTHEPVLLGGVGGEERLGHGGAVLEEQRLEPALTFRSVLHGINMSVGWRLVDLFKDLEPMDI